MWKKKRKKKEKLAQSYVLLCHEERLTKDARILLDVEQFSRSAWMLGPSTIAKTSQIFHLHSLPGRTEDIVYTMYLSLQQLFDFVSIEWEKIRVQSILYLRRMYTGVITLINWGPWAVLQEYPKESYWDPLKELKNYMCLSWGGIYIF